MNIEPNAEFQYADFSRVIVQAVKPRGKPPGQQVTFLAWRGDEAAGIHTAPFKKFAKAAKPI